MNISYVMFLTNNCWANINWTYFLIIMSYHQWREKEAEFEWEEPSRFMNKLTPANEYPEYLFISKYIIFMRSSCRCSQATYCGNFIKTRTQGQKLIMIWPSTHKNGFRAGVIGKGKEEIHDNGHQPPVYRKHIILKITRCQKKKPLWRHCAGLCMNYAQGFICYLTC